MNIKSILLGTAAGLMAVSAANAADLPGEPVPAAVDYVKVCDAMGKGYFYIPGSDTCLKLTGRVRFKVAYSYEEDVESKLSSSADGRVDFLAASATDIGTVTSFFRIKSNTSDTITLDKAWISVKNGGTTVTFGKQANLMDGYGGLKSDNGYNEFDATGNGVTVALDGLGGGFFAGVGFYSYANDATIITSKAATASSRSDLQLVVGLADQAWGKATVGGFYQFDNAAHADYAYGIKGGLELTLTSDLSLAAQAIYGYTNGVAAAANTSFWKVGAGLEYAATSDLSLYGDVSYKMEDKATDENTLGIAIGATYTLAPGLALQTEFDYANTDVDGAADKTVYSAFTRLTRTW